MKKLNKTLVCEKYQRDDYCRTYFIDEDGRSEGKAGGCGAGEHARDLEDKGSEGRHRRWSANSRGKYKTQRKG